ARRACTDVRVRAVHRPQPPPVGDLAPGRTEPAVDRRDGRRPGRARRGPGQLRDGEVPPSLVPPRGDPAAGAHLPALRPRAALAAGADGLRAPPGRRDRAGEPAEPVRLVPAGREPHGSGGAVDRHRIRLHRAGRARRARPARPAGQRPDAGDRLPALDHPRHHRGGDRLRADAPLRRPAAGAVRGGPARRRLRRHLLADPPRPRTLLGRGAPHHPAPSGALRDAHRCALAPPVVGLRPGATRHERNPGMITRRNLLQAAPVAAAGALALSACGGGSGGGEGGSGGSLSWMALLHTPTTPDASGPVHSGLAEETGQQFEIQWVPDASKEEKMNAALASGSVADITSITNLTNSSIRSGVTSGLFWDVEPFLDEFENLKGIDPKTIESARLDGVLYGVPFQKPLARYGVLVRQDWLD